MIDDLSLRSCGICFFDSALWFSSDDEVVRIDCHETTRLKYKARYPMELHSIHPIGDKKLGIVDTGNSVIRIIDKSGQHIETLSFLDSWGDIPKDAVHLNDFTSTPHGLIASCFDYRPYRTVRKDIPWNTWCSQRYGLLINITGNQVVGPGAIVGCGFNHPHSLHYFEPYIYLCSSATGELVRLSLDEHGFVKQKLEFAITSEHFLRGSMRIGSKWVLGGSSMRHGQVVNNTAALYFFCEKTKVIQKYDLSFPGEIYEILPWREEYNPIFDSLS